MSGAVDIRLLLADVDGTLVTGDKRLTEETLDAARELREAGIVLTIISSRPPRGLRPLIAPLALLHPVVGFNGGMLVNPDLTIIESHPLDPFTAQEVLTLIEDHGLDAWVYTEQDWLIRDRSAAHVAHEIETLMFDPTVVASFTAAHMEQAVKIVGISDDPALLAACGAAIGRSVGTRVSAACSQVFFLDVTHPDANKGAAVATLSKLLNILPAQIATIGDMPSDVLMFRESGFSIAMGNASDAVKAQASAVADSNENEGFAKAVRNFILRSGERT